MLDSKEQVRLLRDVRLALQNDDYLTAIASLEKASKIAGDSGDIGMEGRHLGNLALLYYRLKQPHKALENFERALKLAREDKDRATEDGLLGNMGNILREMGRFQEAYDYLKQALEIAEEIDDTRGQGIWLANMGLLYDDVKQLDEALSCHQESVAVARELHDMRGLAMRLGNLGNTHVSLGDYEQGIEVFKEAITLFEQLNDKQGLALRLGVIGNLFAELGRKASTNEDVYTYSTQALDYYRKTLDIAQELGDPLSQAELLRSMGHVLVNIDLVQESIEHLKLSRDLFKQLGDADKVREVEESLLVVLEYKHNNKK